MGLSWAVVWSVAGFVVGEELGLTDGLISMLKWSKSGWRIGSDLVEGCWVSVEDGFCGCHCWSLY